MGVEVDEPGRDDESGRVDAVRLFARLADADKQLVVLPGADHARTG